jgi:hypothetical protein
MSSKHVKNFGSREYDDGLTQDQIQFDLDRAGYRKEIEAMLSIAAITIKQKSDSEKTSFLTELARAKRFIALLITEKTNKGNDGQPVITEELELLKGIYRRLEERELQIKQ